MRRPLMQPRPIRHRRARRSDFDAICALVESSGLSAPGPERAALRRFRRLVADLGADLYVAEIDARVRGVVHVTYTRHLAHSPQARLELLAVAPEARQRGVGRSLVAVAAARARRRGCAELRCGRAAATGEARAFLLHTGWQRAGEELEFDLAVPAQ
jgi:N-acetylglutamate synthase-like GNAT family acetyltransferase